MERRERTAGLGREFQAELEGPDISQLEREGTAGEPQPPTPRALCLLGTVSGKAIKYRSVNLQSRPFLYREEKPLPERGADLPKVAWLQPDPRAPARPVSPFPH